MRKGCQRLRFRAQNGLAQMDRRLSGPARLLLPHPASDVDHGHDTPRPCHRRRARLLPRMPRAWSRLPEPCINPSGANCIRIELLRDRRLDSHRSEARNCSRVVGNPSLTGLCKGCPSTTQDPRRWPEARSKSHRLLDVNLQGKPDW